MDFNSLTETLLLLLLVHPLQSGLDATSNNTADNLVARDGSGNFSAGTINAALSGNVTGDVVGNVTVYNW